MYEAVLKKEIDAPYRVAAISTLVSLYSRMGDYENAEKTTRIQSPLQVSKEVLLASAADDEKGDRYRGEAILALMNELKTVVEKSVIFKNSLAHSQAGLDKLLAVVHLYESIFDDGNCGKFHSDLCMLYLRCSVASVHLKDFDSASGYFDVAFDHFTKYKQERKNFHFTALLVEKAGNTAIGVVVLNREIFELYMKSLPDELADTIRNEPKYAPIFAE